MQTKTMRFKDHFSGHSELYSRYRPVYPAALYRFLADQAPSKALALDCATGSGQAAFGLAPLFRHVIATDASAAQLEKAEPAANIEYRVAPAEQSGLEDSSVDLITVAQALHWFDGERFYAEAERVLKPGGVLAVWCYGLLYCESAIEAQISYLYRDIVGPYWPPERIHIEQGYHDLPFPFKEQSSPEFYMTAEWDLQQLLGYLRTWSAVQRYTREKGHDPLDLVEQELAELWGDPLHHRPIRWPLSLRWGYKP